MCEDQASLICDSMVAPLGEKARPLEKTRLLEPLSTGATTGSTGAVTCSTAAALGSTGTSRGLMQLFQAPLGQFC